MHFISKSFHGNVHRRQIKTKCFQLKVKIAILIKCNEIELLFLVQLCFFVTIGWGFCFEYKQVSLKWLFNKAWTVKISIFWNKDLMFFQTQKTPKIVKVLKSSPSTFNPSAYFFRFLKHYLHVGLKVSMIRKD